MKIISKLTLLCLLISVEQSTQIHASSRILRAIGNRDLGEVKTIVEIEHADINRIRQVTEISPSLTDNEENTALLHAIGTYKRSTVSWPRDVERDRRESFTVVEYLVKQGADLSKQSPQNCNNSPVHEVAHPHSSAVLELFIKHHAPLSLKNKFGQTALDRAKQTASNVTNTLEYREKYYKICEILEGAQAVISAPSPLKEPRTSKRIAEKRKLESDD